MFPLLSGAWGPIEVKNGPKGVKNTKLQFFQNMVALKPCNCTKLYIKLRSKKNNQYVYTMFVLLSGAWYPIEVQNGPKCSKRAIKYMKLFFFSKYGLSEAL